MNNSRSISTVLATVAIAALISLPSPAMAQSASVTASSTIETPLTVSSITSLDFGTIQRGHKTTIHENDAEAAAIVVSGDAEDNITVVIPDEFTLTTNSGDGGSMTVDIRKERVRSNTVNSQRHAHNHNVKHSDLSSALSSDDDGNGTNNDGLGQLYVWFGADITPSHTQQRGVYSGTITISAAYSN